MSFSKKLLIIFISIVVTIPIPTVLALRPEDINEMIAEQITVSIVDDGNNSNGSGIIIDRESQINSYTYSVLTAHHVVNNSTLDEDGNHEIETKKYKITTFDGKSHNVTLSDENHKLDPRGHIDLAVVKFTSNREYKIADLGNSNDVKRLTKVYIAGYVRRQDKNSDLRLSFYPGSVVDLNLPSKEGYRLVYNVIPIKGLSGGPVLDEQGKLIAVYAMTDYIIGRKDPVGSLGIPINIYKKLADKQRRIEEVGKKRENTPSSPESSPRQTPLEVAIEELDMSLIEACDNYNGTEIQNQILKKLQNLIPSDIRREFAIRWRSDGSPDSLPHILRNNQISLVDVCQVYKKHKKQHQKQAIEWLQEQIDKLVSQV